MYEEFFGLKEKPFSIQPDPDYLYFTKRHQLAYSMLEYGVENRAGFTVITGEIGCGKTTLLRHLLNNLPLNARVGLVSNLTKDVTDPLDWVMMAFDQPFEGKSRAGLFDAFQHFLIDEYAAAKRSVLIIDEAQNLSVEALEALRMYSNINADKDQLLQIILVGQPQLMILLQQPELQQFAQRVSVDFHLTGLNKAEVGLYILHRLKVAGCEKSIFSHEAIMAIAKVSGGIPRSINILCDTALVYAFSQSIQRVDKKVLKEVLGDKMRYGVFNKHEHASDDPKRSAKRPRKIGSDRGENGEKRKPALVVYDKKLARNILSGLDWDDVEEK